MLRTKPMANELNLTEKKTSELTLEELQSKQTGGILSLEEQAALKKKEEKTNDGKGPGVIKRSGEKPHVQWEDLDGIKQTDIIEYMMNEWFIKAMNKGFSAAVYGVEWVGKHIEYAYDEYRENKAANAKKDEKKKNLTPKEEEEKKTIEGTTTFKETAKLFGFMSEEIKERNEKIDGMNDIAGNAQKIQEAIAKHLTNDPKAFEGLEPDARLHLQSKIKDMPKEDLEKMAKGDLGDLEKEQKNLNELRKITHTISTQVATAEIAERLSRGEIISDEDKKKFMKESSDSYAKHMKEALDRTTSPEAAEKLMNTLGGLSKEALKNAHEAHETGKIGQNTPENKALNTFKKTLNIFDKSHYKKIGLYQYSEEVGIILDKESKIVDVLNGKNDVLEAQKAIHEEKKKRLEAWKQKHPDKAKGREGKDGDVGLVSGRGEKLKEYYKQKKGRE